MRPTIALDNTELNNRSSVLLEVAILGLRLICESLVS